MAGKGRLAPSQISVGNQEAITIVSERAIRIDPNKLSAPSDLYDADYAWATERLGVVSLFFGKEDLNKSRLRTRLEVRFSPIQFVDHFWKNSRDFHGMLRSFVAKFPPDSVRETFKPETWDAIKDHSVWVNLDYLAHSAHEAYLDFYDLSIRGLATFVAKQGSEGLEVTPIVRVKTTAQELCRLLDSCDTMVQSLRERFPEEQDAGKDSLP